MKKLLAVFLAALCMVLCLSPVTALAETEGENDQVTGQIETQDAAASVITIDVSGEATENENYQIDGTSIKLRKRNVQYVLTGTTDKKVSVWGNNDSEQGANEAHYITLNGATLNGGIVVENSPVRMVVEVADGTVNTIKRLAATDLTIKGKGTLNTTGLNVTQKHSYMSSKLSISDATITVTEPADSGDSCQWNGVCELSGDAKVTYISQNNYAPLKMGVKSGDNTHSLTLKDKAELHCLHQNPDEESQSFVSGLELFRGNLTLEGNSLLEAQGRPATDPDFNGSGIVANENCDILVKDSAEIKATAPGVAISMFGNLTVSGGKITAKSTHSNGIYVGSELRITDGAEVKASGDWPAVFVENGITIDGSSVEATSSGSNAICNGTDGDIEIRNSLVKANAEGHRDSIMNWADDGKIIVENSWLETTGEEDYGENIKDSVRFIGKNGKVIGNAKLPSSVTVEDGMTLTIPKDASLSVGQGNTLTNAGKITREGKLTKDGGEIVCLKHFGNPVWTFDDKTHTKTWDCCEEVEIRDEEHEMDGRKCVKCGYEIKSAEQPAYPDYDEPVSGAGQTGVPAQNENPAQDDDLKAPKTGENSLMLLYALLAMSGAAVIAAMKKFAK